LLHRALAENGGRAFFSVVIERLGDLFEPRLCDVYAQLFAQVVEIVRPEFKTADLLARYDRVRRVRRCTLEPRNVFVLSRVTLGADVAVTSVVMDAIKRRFLNATIWFVGSRRNYELFQDDSRITHLAWPYPRTGSIAERLAVIPQLPDEDAIIIDPDTRLTQLGLLPVCAEERYYFFESRCCGGDGSEPLPVLASRWMQEVFGVPLARPYVAPLRAQMPFDVAVSFGVGENEEKRMPDPFEEQLLRAIVSRGMTVLLDKGAGGEESERAMKLAAAVPQIRLYDGPYAPFASMISQARLYIGYDSAGQHVAAASATPLVSIFAGYPSERMFERWHPHGRGPVHVVKAAGKLSEEILGEVVQYLIL
jgi:ADP-heptose:LPS heptosyltransferase